MALLRFIGKKIMALFICMVNFVRRFFDLAGYYLVIRKKDREYTAHHYEQALPIANYAPWLSDISFRETYGIIKDYTKVDIYRCYELWQLIEQTAKLDGALIEIGVWRGGSGALIAKKAILSGIKDKIYLCDTFTGVVKAGAHDFTYKGGEHADTTKETVEKLLDKLKLDNTKILVGIFPEATSKLVSDKTFRFCHVDVDVYQSAKDIVEWIWPRLAVGGMVVFDDYGFQGCVGVTRFVNEERNKKDRLVIHNLNGHGIFIKLSD